MTMTSGRDKVVEMVTLREELLSRLHDIENGIIEGLINTGLANMYITVNWHKLERDIDRDVI